MNSKDREYYSAVVKVGLDSSAEEQFLWAMAQESFDGNTPEEFLAELLWIAQELHKDFRWCGSPKCGYKVPPATTVRMHKHGPDPESRSTYSTAPVESCFECGAATITTEEYYARAALNETWGCMTHVRHMRARLAVERAYPARTNGAPFGAGPAPDVEVVPVARKKPRKGPAA